MHYSLRFLPYAIFFCVALIGINQLFLYVKLNYPEAIAWSSDAPIDPLDFNELVKLGPFFELVGETADTLQEVPSLFLESESSTSMKKVFVAMRSPTCPTARTYARSIQALALAHPDIEFVSILPSAEDIEEFKESIWEIGRVLVDPSLFFWKFIWFALYRFLYDFNILFRQNNRKVALGISLYSPRAIIASVKTWIHERDISLPNGE
jgi:hypothetical protein